LIKAFQGITKKSQNNSRNVSQENLLSLMSYPRVTPVRAQRPLVSYHNKQYKTSAQAGLLYRYMNSQPIQNNMYYYK